MSKFCFVFLSPDNIYCPTHFDDWLCWDFTLAGTTATQQCPYKFNDQLRADKEAEKVCLEDGTWYVNPISNKTWTDYSNCATDVLKVCSHLTRRADIDHNTRTEVHAKPGTMRDTGLRVCSHLTKREHVDHDKGTEVHAKPGTVRDTGLRVCSHLTKREHVDHAKGTEVPDKSGTVRDQSVCVTHTRTDWRNSITLTGQGVDARVPRLARPGTGHFSSSSSGLRNLRTSDGPRTSGLGEAQSTSCKHFAS
ncbi:hypothetical protein RRG08_032550 [Elysia crispata]|uniref:G-protein coupled receptors family 2 profile 1 domain-containing protein n=1 Tax=Elysia crispata TaxID=231223 RepID=A0AAE0ZZE6_9GAST|nr:hypothetical protein RRG08_032550 [Elysia crispata]